MHVQRSEPAFVLPTEAVPIRSGVAVLSGYGLVIRVERGQLLVRDGIGRQRREARFHRATSGLKRLVVLGHTGFITLEAIRWLADIGAAYVQIDADGKLLAAFGGGAGYEQPKLRRAQARALGEPEGLEIARWLIARKLDGQKTTLEALARIVPGAEAAIEALDQVARGLAVARDADAVRAHEAAGAIAYWQAWSRLPVHFAERDVARVPAHFLSFGSRVSAITGQPRSATNPANALLNYLYAILEGEAAIAARVVGLDPGIGVFHLDARYRASLASDLMEPVRPEVDRYVLETIAQRTFGARDFWETRTGTVKVTPGLAKELAATALHWRPLVGGVAEDVAHALLDPPAYDPLPRPITRPFRSRSAADAPRLPDGRTSLRSIQRRCVVCGKPTAERAARTCSPECLELSLLGRSRLGAVRQVEKLKKRLAEGIHREQTQEARAKQAAGVTRRRAEQRAWDVEHPERPDPEVFRREIFPGLASISAYRLAKATGLSTAQCARIKGGIVPHASRWELLRHAIGQSGVSHTRV